MGSIRTGGGATIQADSTFDRALYVFFRSGEASFQTSCLRDVKVVQLDIHPSQVGVMSRSTVPPRATLGRIGGITFEVHVMHGFSERRGLKEWYPCALPIIGTLQVGECLIACYGAREGWKL